MSNEEAWQHRQPYVAHLILRDSQLCFVRPFGRALDFIRARRFIDRTNNIEVDFLLTGLYPGGGKPGPIAFPDPSAVAQQIEKAQVVNLTSGSTTDLPAADAARAVAADRPEWASLQFYAARVLRDRGRGADARAALDALAASTVVHRRDRPLVEAERAAL